MSTSTTMSSPNGYQLRFRSLFDEARGDAFPCDARGHVDLGALNDRAMNNYLYARAMVGREFFLPEVESLFH